jgi:hypothetical protein
MLKNGSRLSPGLRDYIAVLSKLNIFDRETGELYNAEVGQGGLAKRSI